MKQKITSRGFTLIELLIVIAIIGVLATLILVNILGVRMRARDAQRKADLKQIQSAIELYRADQSKYPTSLPACGSSFAVGPTTYMQKIPCDPLSSSQPYIYTSNASTYSIVACLENTSDPQKDGSPNPACASGTVSYTVNNP